MCVTPAPVSRHAPLAVHDRSEKRDPRRGMILVTVVAFLSLLLSLSLAFVFYANQQALSMRFQREAAQGGRTARVNQGSRGYTDEAPPQAVDIASAALGQLIYDAPDDETGVWSALRGASLGRAMYGLYYDGTPQAPSYANNDVPFNGIGRYRSATGSYAPALLAQVTDGNFRAVNYTYHAEDGFVRDPERIGYRAHPQSAAWNMNGNLATRSYFPINAPYTYPDEKDIYLAAVRPSDGRVLVPSFYRPSTFGSLAPDNPNWTNAVGKYLIHRPRPIDMGPGFPAVPPNADGSYTGDIEQLQGKQVHQNDSLWLDLDLPVHKWRGRLYKPLVAFLAIDLDGRINVNVAGNRRGLANLNASNQGWGDWETDMQPLLVCNQASTLFFNPNGRYGSDRVPNRPFAANGTANAGGSNLAPFGARSPFYAQADFDGSILTNAGLGTRMQLPQAPSTRSSPIYPPRYGGSSTAERLNHPLLFNPYLLSSPPSFASGGQDRTFNAGDMFLLNNWFNGDDAHYAQAQLGQLLPQDLGRSCTPGSNGWPAGAVNPRFLLTTISNDLDRPGLVPWLLDQPSTYTMVQPPPVNGVYPPAAQPTGPGVSFPSLQLRTAPAPAAAGVDDFAPKTWRADGAAFGSVDLNRPLTDYRSNPSAPFEQPGNVTAASAARALADRQQFATDIFRRLCGATGSRPANAVPGSPSFNALRYLAQLAVNIVDFLDNDDYITPFVWNPIDPANPLDVGNFAPAELPNRVVFGTELPRFVVNEACIRVENGSMIPGQPDTDPGLVPPVPPPLGWQPKATFYNIKVWAELINPMTPGPAATANLAYGGGVPFTCNGNQVYRLLLTAPNATLRQTTNVKGDPDGVIQQTVNLPAGVYASVNGVIPVSSGAYIQPRSPTSSFYVVGPEPMPGDLVMPSALTDSMKYRIPTTNYNRGEAAATTLLMQRLACTQLPPGPANPYVTTDYMTFTKNMLADARIFDQNGLIVPPPLGIVLQCSWGRMQPYAGNPSQVVPQQVIPVPVAGLSHTLFRHNGQGDLLTNAGLTLTQPFDWLVHLDRDAISPIELLNVSAYKPHELTQQFIVGAANSEQKFQHLADWASDSTRLHRALAVLETRSRTLGTAAGGRVPGRVNINTVWDGNIFQALCAANSANDFSASDVAAIWQALAGSRTPGGAPSAVSGQDRPFWSAAAPIVPALDVQFPNGSGVADTLLRPNPAQPATLLLDLPNQAHPYLRRELLNKIYGRLTTRSHVFAVWMTLGYFEVTDSRARPVKLGPELGLNDGTNIRHHYFAVIDRSNLTIDPAHPRAHGPRPVFFSYEPVPSTAGADPATPGAVTATIPAQSFDGAVLRGLYDESAWELRNHDRLLMDVGANQEMVPVRILQFTPGGGATIRLVCGKTHARGCPLMIGNTRLGNPGPQPGFHVRNPCYAGIVRLFVAID